MIHDVDIETAELNRPNRIGAFCYHIHSDDAVSVLTADDEQGGFLNGPDAWSAKAVGAQRR